MARLSKGVHVVLEPPAEPWAAALTTPLPGGRVTFAAPWEGMLLLGTTDTEYCGDPGQVRVEPEDVKTVLGEAAVALPSDVLARERIRYSFAGLRVLPRGAGSTAAAHREELIRTGAAGMVSVAGGKLTTHRQIALRVLRHLQPFSHARLSSDPLPGGGPLPDAPADVPPEVLAAGPITRCSGETSERRYGINPCASPASASRTLSVADAKMIERFFS